MKEKNDAQLYQKIKECKSNYTETQIRNIIDDINELIDFYNENEELINRICNMYNSAHYDLEQDIPDMLYQISQAIEN